MTVPAQVFTWPPGGGDLAINRLHWSMFDLPAEGSRYWHGQDPYVVRTIDATTDPVTVHLEHAQAWADELRQALPPGYWLDGGRNSRNGEWHFTLIKDGVERPIGLFYGESVDQAINEAVEGAHARENQ